MTSVEAGAVAAGRRRLLAAIEGMWRELQAAHPELPDVLVTWEPEGRRRTPAVPQHLRSRDWTGELALTDTRARASVKLLVAALLHEAAHGLAAVRGVDDTSREGRYHNVRYRELAREVGLEVEESGVCGWSVTTAPAELVDRLLAGDVGRELEDALAAYRPPPAAARRGVTKVSATCGCTGAAARSIRLPEDKLALGPITCGVCDQPFTLVTPPAQPAGARVRRHGGRRAT